MQKLLEGAYDKKYNRIVGIDPSTQKMAFVLVEKGEPISRATIDMGAGDIYDRLLRLRKFYPALLRLWKPDFVQIEQAIFVQNPETSRKIAYAVGIIAAETKFNGVEFTDVAPASWKAYLGVKPLTKSWKQRIIIELGEKEGRKEINRLRKSQTIDILTSRFPHFDWSDSDIADAAAIGLFAFSLYGTLKV